LQHWQVVKQKRRRYLLLLNARQHFVRHAFYASYIGIIQDWKKVIASMAFNAFVRAILLP
jgi:hypothetical protein